MSPSLQPAPEQRPNPAALAAYAERLYSTSGGSSPAGSQASGFTAKLAYDDRAKAKWHALVLILPLAVLIFSEALRFPTEKIELPIIKLKLEIEQVLPLFLLILSSMLHRAPSLEKSDKLPSLDLNCAEAKASVTTVKIAPAPREAKASTKTSEVNHADSDARR